jgi:hypothetical protein
MENSLLRAWTDRPNSKAVADLYAQSRVEALGCQVLEDTNHLAHLEAARARIGEYAAGALAVDEIPGLGVCNLQAEGVGEGVTGVAIAAVALAAGGIIARPAAEV